MKMEIDVDAYEAHAIRVRREAALYEMSWNGHPMMPPLGIRLSGGWNHGRRLSHQEAERYHLEEAAKTVGTEAQAFHLREAFRHRVSGTG